MVYHQLIAGNSFTRILCGSLIDEAWILELITYIMQFSSGTRRWIKQIRTPFEEPDVLYVLISSNLQKCPSITDYIKSIHEFKVVPIKITNEEIPKFFDFKRKMHDATSMDLRVLARKI